MADVAADHEAEGQSERTPLLEWVAGAIGAILTLTLSGFWAGRPGRTPATCRPR